jgi:NAD(P)-dependent dehydrogenase (short-subunit alcohol dehydrogenase family)
MSAPRPPTALITGATGLIGTQVCLALARAGCRIAGAYHQDEESARALAARAAEHGGHLVALRSELSSPEEGARQLFDAAVDALGPPDVFVGCAGLKSRRPIVATSDPMLAEIFGVNVRAQLGLARLSLRAMQRKGWGRIVLVGSRAGSEGSPGQAAYAASMGALSAWAASAAGEVGHGEITVNVVAPGALVDPETALYSADEAEAVTRQIGSRRLGEPREVAAVIAFLCSPDASYVNGATLPVDGGARF